MLIQETKEHQDPEHIDFSVPRRAQYLHSAWKKHQDAVFWVDINLAIQKGLPFYQTRSNAIILQETLPVYCIPKVVRLELGSEHTQRSEVGQLSRSFQSNQPVLSPSRERTERSVVKDDTRTVQDGRNTSRPHGINVNSFNEELSSSDRTGRLVETEEIQTRSSEDSKILNVEQTHDRKGRLVATLHTAEAQDSSRVRSAHESDTLNVDDDEVLRKRTEDPLLFMTRIMNQ